jgi:flagellar motor switch/type III secretory pathway protein FliN
MAGSALQKENSDAKRGKGDLLKDPLLNVIFQYLQSEFCPRVTKAGREFWGAELKFSLSEIANKPNPLWKENDFFVTRINPAREVDLVLKISDAAANILFLDSIGKKTSGKGDPYSLSLKEITELEANILKSFNEFLYKGVSDLFLNPKQIHSILHTIHEEKTLYLTFYVYLDSKQAAGRIILSFPQFILKKILPLQPPENLPDINKFNDSLVEADILIGKTFATLDEIKALELEDIVILDDSNIHIMNLKSLRDIAININPRSSLVVNLEEDNTDSGDIGMTEQRNTKSIWDSLEVEVGASFEKVKMKLGSLREITEGLVIDVASVADNKVFLDVEGRKIATGELVIVGDKYGVKVTGIIDEAKTDEERRVGARGASQAPIPAQKPASHASNSAPKTATVTNVVEETEEDVEIEDDFDEADFDLEDEIEEEEEREEG